MKQHLTIDEILLRLEARDCQVKRSGKDYRTQCPAHGGDGLSLAFREGKAGQVLFTCHSHHCSYEDIMRSLGIEKIEKSPVPVAQTAFGKKVHKTFEKAVAAYSYGDQPKEKPDKIYRYDNIDGSENLFMLRWDGANGKRIRPITKVCGGYICGESTDGALPIYNLSKINEHIRDATNPVHIIVTEGEKAAEAAMSLGFFATTSAFGSGSAHKTDWAALDRIAVKHGKKLELIVLPDHDEPGRKYVDTITDVFMSFKSKPKVKIVSLSDHKDVTGIERFPEGGDLADLCELLDSKTTEEIADMLDAMIAKSMPEAEIVEDEEMNSVYPWHPFPVDILPQMASRFIHQVADANRCDPAGPSIATLIALATAIGNSRRIRLKRGWVFPAILWGMLIARKGSIKSWALAPPIKPLDLKQDEYHAQNIKDKAEYDTKKAEYNRMTPTQRRNAPPFDLKEPIVKRIVSRETTEQKLVKNCAENPRGLCLFSDELTTLLKGLGQYCNDAKGGNAQSIFNSLFNGEGIESERIGESRHAPHAFVCILGGIQPGMAKKCFDQEAFESGFASRFIPVSPPLRIATWSDAIVDEETEQQYYRLIFAILDLEMEQIFDTVNVDVCEWNPDGNATATETEVVSEPIALRPILIDTSPEALDIYKEFYNRTAEEMLHLEDDNIRGTFEKLRTYAARLALVIHVTRFVEQELFLQQNIDSNTAPWDHSQTRINELECDANSMQIAVTLADWFKYETRRVYSTWGGLADEKPTPKGDPLRQRIVEFMEQRREPISLREIQRKLTIKRDVAQTAMDDLTSLGIVERIDSGKGGKITKWRLQQVA